MESGKWLPKLAVETVLERIGRIWKTGSVRRVGPLRFGFEELEERLRALYPKRIWEAAVNIHASLGELFYGWAGARPGRTNLWMSKPQRTNRPPLGRSPISPYRPSSPRFSSSRASPQNPIQTRHFKGFRKPEVNQSPNRNRNKKIEKPGQRQL